jgi:putative Mg2+ transporter-C (MgtC) family protein
MEEQLSNLLALAAAAVLGGLLGLQREVNNHWAGLRTHMLVALGTALLVLSVTGIAKDTESFLSRVIQGVAAGIGFIGAGTILKVQERVEIHGLTTASTLWVAAAVGVVCGMKLYVLAAGAVAIGLLILTFLGRVERRLDKVRNSPFFTPLDDDKPEKNGTKRPQATRSRRP